MGSEALKAREVILNNKYVMLINTDESDAAVQSKSMNPSKLGPCYLSMWPFEACDADQQSEDEEG